MTNTMDHPHQDERAADPLVQYVEISGFDHLSRMARPTLRQIIGHLLLTAVLAAIGGQIGWFGAGLLDERFEALSEIEYRGSSWTETQDVTIRSRSLIEPIANSFDIPIKEFEQRLGAGLVPGTQLLRITYEHEDPATAIAVVEAMTDRYLEVYSELPPPETRERLEATLDDLNQELATAQAALLAIPQGTRPGLTIEQQELQSEISTLRSRIGVIELRLLDGDLLELDTFTSGIPRIVTQPFAFEEAVFPRVKMLTAIGVIAGGALGLLIMAIHWNRIAWAATRI